MDSSDLRPRKIVDPVTRDIEELRERLEKLEREVAEEPAQHKVWKPKDGKGYFALYCNGNILYQYNQDSAYDRGCYNQGHAFPTREAAELYQKRERTLADMRRIAEKHGGGELPPKGGCWTVAYSPKAKMWTSRYQEVTRPGEVRFPDEKSARESITVLDLDVFLEDA